MKRLSRFLCLLALIMLTVLPAHATWPAENTTDFQGGKGTIAEPYLVSTATQLDNVRKYPNAHFKQTATILLSDYGNWTPIGTESAPFYGTYDGNGYTIYGLTITRSGSATTHIGLFGYSRGYISGVTLENVSITATFTYGTGCSMGAVAGYSNYEIVGCSVSGSIQCTLSNNGANIGGIVGYGNAASYCQNSADITVMTSASSPSVNYVNIGGVMGNGYDDIAYCANSGDIYSNCSNTEMGGVCGNAWTLIGCSNSGSVTLDTFSTRTTNSSNWNKVGGVTGYLVSSAKDCTNSGAVIASGYNCDAGGIAGRFEGSSNADVIDQCRVSGSVSTVGESGSANTTYGHIGGVVGAAQGGNITNCYAVGTVKLNNNSTDTCLSGGIVGEVEADDTVVDSCYSLVNSIATNTGASWWARGALVGYNSGIVTNCYWSSYSWGVASNYGTDNSKSVTLSKFKTQSTYSGFDFTNVWKMGTGTYTYATLKMESGHTHSLSYTAEKHNCADGGYLAHWYCAGCDTYFKGQGSKPVSERMVKVYAGDHTYDFGKDPNGTYGGHTAFACIDCGASLAPDGQCGKTVWYNRIGDALYIYGSGSMYNYNGYTCYSSYGDAPWKGEAITYVDIKKGVTTVGQGAFYYSCDISSYRDDTNKYLTTVRLPEGLLTVDESAFAYCTVLKSINIPDSVSLLGRYAFRDCRSLETLSMNVDTVDSYCFEFCTSLKEITFGSNLYTIANTVFDKGTTNKETLKITFLGNAPYFDSITFNRQTVEAHYPICNTTWTDSVKQNYSGTVTWVADGSHTPGDPTQTDISSATCTEDGSYTDVIACQACNTVISTTPKVIDKLGHSFTNYIINEDATCLEDGTKTAKCDRCEVTDTQTDAGSAKGHTHEAVVTAPTCTDKGYTTHTCHCGDTYVDSEVPALNHSFTDYRSNNDATCTADGTETAKCDRCEVTDTQADPDSKLGHDMGDWVTTEMPTCTEDGTQQKDCARCDYFETQSVEATGHSYGDLVVIGPGMQQQSCNCGDTRIQYNTGWALWENRWYFRKADNTLAIGWFLDGNIWYFLDNNGVMKTGWLQDGGAWYYMQSSGAMATGWIKDGGVWYYMQPSGAMVTGWIKVGGIYYYFNSSGAMLTGWVKDGGVWYYMNASGAMVTGWQKIGSTWYYFKTSGAMQTGWLQLGSTWYYFNTSGAMVTGTQYIGGVRYVFDGNGVWIG